MAISDTTMKTLHQAMRGLSVRQRVIADNVANIQTPGFSAAKVDFESSLRRAVDGGKQPEVADISTTNTTDPARQDGNNVNLDDETVGMLDTNLKYDAMVQAMNAKFRLLRSAIGG